jgi:hypothetical protein
LKIKMDVNALEQELKEVKDELKGIKKALSSVGLSDMKESALRNDRVALLARLDKLENEIKSLTTSTSTPAPAPPGNSITLPQVLPLSSIASFLSSSAFFRIRFRQPLQLNYKICDGDDEGGGEGFVWMNTLLCGGNCCGCC